METSKRQVTIIDELWDNEQSNANRRLYDEQDRTWQRQNIQLNDRLKRFEKQLEVLQPKDQDKEAIRKALSKQTSEYNKLLTKKDEEIEQLNERVKELSKPNSLESALRQSNIDKLHLEKRLLSSASSLSSTTTTNTGPSRTVSTSTTEQQQQQTNSPRRSSPSVSPVNATSHPATQSKHDLLNTEVHRLTLANEDYTSQLKLQLRQYHELEEAYKQLENKYSQLADFEERYRQEKLALDASRQESDQLKQKLADLENENRQKHSIETDLSSLKATNEDLRTNIERLQSELQSLIKERETHATTITQLTNATATNERLTNEGEKLLAALTAKSDEFDSKKQENEQLKHRNAELESTIKSIRDTNDLQKRLNDENEVNKQDDLEQFQKMHDVTKREQQTIIHQLQDKIRNLEHKTGLQSLKHEEILLQFETLKTQRERASSGNTLSPNNPSSLMLDTPTMLRDDSAPLSRRQQRSASSHTKSPQIVRAKYTYEPLKFSPNDHPESELALKLGEHYLVYGDIDEDGFYDGRNLEGRFGLIPSNFVELVTNPNDLPDNTKYLIQKLTGQTLPTNERNSRHREETVSLDSDVFNISTPAATPMVRKPTDSSTSSDISTDEYSFGKRVPFPTNFRVEKSLNNSMLISWNPPSSNTPILGYQVLLDHSLYSTVRTHEPTRCLIGNINLNDKFHRISIRTITQRGLSHDQECTLLLTNSKDFSSTPNDLRVDRITQTSAVVSWWPASNDITHKLLVNDIEVQTLKPGIYRFKISGLSPATTHKVTIKAKPPVLSNPQQQLATSIEFRTTSFDELLEPPKRVQVVPGPQANTLLVSWEPPSSVSIARGYRVLIDGRQVQDVMNVSNDHTVINLDTVRPGRVLTVRTLTDNKGESRDSSPVDLDDVFKKITSINSSLMGKEMNKSLIRSSLESPSTVSSISTDVPQIELKSNSPVKSPGKPRSSTNSNHIGTPMNENKSITPDDHRSTPTTPSRNARLQPSAGVNTHLLQNINGSPRTFIALFDYDPHAMSPNQNNDEELPFKHGQIIKIYGVQDGDGFYIGQTENGHTGYVPSNMVSELEVDSSVSESQISIASPPKRSPTTPKSIKKMRALFDYDPSQSSPNINRDEELSFHSGDIIYVRGSIDDDGFYNGQLENGQKGLVPSNFVKEVAVEVPIPKENPTIETKSSLTTVNTESEKSIEPAVAPPAEAANGGFFDRLKNTFSWDTNKPI